MKRILAVITLVGLLAVSGQLLAALPGGYHQYSARIFVYDQDGIPLSGITVQLYVQTTGIWGTQTCVKNGTTDSDGFAYLECLIAPEYSDQLDWMKVTLINNNYLVLYSENTATITWASIMPFFYITNPANDSDGNLIYDPWEMTLAQMVCPALFQPKDDNGGHWNAPGWDYTLRAVPVEAMDFNGDGVLNAHDVLVEVYNTGPGQFVGLWMMDELTVGGSPYTNKYPDLVKPAHEVNFRPPGKALWSIRTNTAFRMGYHG